MSDIDPQQFFLGKQARCVREAELYVQSQRCPGCDSRGLLALGTDEEPLRVEAACQQCAMNIDFHFHKTDGFGTYEQLDSFGPLGEHPLDLNAADYRRELDPSMEDIRGLLEDLAVERRDNFRCGIAEDLLDAAETALPLTGELLRLSPGAGSEALVHEVADARRRARQEIER